MANEPDGLPQQKMSILPTEILNTKSETTSETIEVNPENKINDKNEQIINEVNPSFEKTISCKLLTINYFLTRSFSK